MYILATLSPCALNTPLNYKSDMRLLPALIFYYNYWRYIHVTIDRILKRWENSPYSKMTRIRGGDSFLQIISCLWMWHTWSNLHFYHFNSPTICPWNWSSWIDRCSGYTSASYWLPHFTWLCCFYILSTWCWRIEPMTLSSPKSVIVSFRVASIVELATQLCTTNEITARTRRW